MEAAVYPHLLNSILTHSWEISSCELLRFPSQCLVDMTGKIEPSGAFLNDPLGSKYCVIPIGDEPEACGGGGIEKR